MGSVAPPPLPLLLRRSCCRIPAELSSAGTACPLALPRAPVRALALALGLGLGLGLGLARTGSYPDNPGKPVVCCSAGAGARIRPEVWCYAELWCADPAPILPSSTDVPRYLARIGPLRRDRRHHDTRRPHTGHSKRLTARPEHRGSKGPATRTLRSTITSRPSPGDVRRLPPRRAARPATCHVSRPAYHAPRPDPAPKCGICPALARDKWVLARDKWIWPLMGRIS
jgi:hypothetical protein